jgi:hypothetical protein
MCERRAGLTRFINILTVREKVIVKGAELLVRCLEREGVRYIFGVPGKEIMDVSHDRRSGRHHGL